MIPDDQWERFFNKLAEVGIITTACQASGIAPRTVYSRIDVGKAADATPEQKDWLDRYNLANKAAIDRLEQEVYRRAVEGVSRPQFTKDGDPIYMPADPGETRQHYYETTYSDTLLMFVLRGRDPGKYKDRVANEISGPNGKPIQTETKVIAVPAIEENAPE